MYVDQSAPSQLRSDGLTPVVKTSRSVLISKDSQIHVLDMFVLC